MKTPILAAIRCSLIFLVPTVSYAISAQWDLDPLSGNWNRDANWTPEKAPNGSADIATFGFSNVFGVFIPENTEVKGIVFTSEATTEYVINPNRGKTLTISGGGITNNSGRQQHFVSPGGRVGNLTGGRIEFTNDARAGINDTFLSDGGQDSGGRGGVTVFSGNSHAVKSIFIASSFGVTGAESGSTIFSGTSHADSAVLIAGNTPGGPGGTIFFQENSHGDRSRVEVFGDGTLDLSEHNPAIFTIGSIEGDGRVVLPQNFELNIGGNNMDTTFSGVIEGFAASTDLHKVGTGTLTLSGDASIGGDTDVDHGVLQVDGSVHGVNIFVFQGGTLAGTGTVNGNVTNNGRVSPGSTGAPGMLTVAGNYVGGFLTIQIAGTSDGQFSVLDVIGKDSIAELGGTLNPVLLGFMPTVGDTFAFLLYPDTDPDMLGKFSRIKNQVFNNRTERWEVTYERTEAILTATKNVPDQGSTLLLLTLGLLGLVTFRRQLLRGQI
jgi:autotransporter-associated beta strand protein